MRPVRIGWFVKGTQRAARIAFFVCCLSWPGGMVAAAGDDKIFTVGNYPVEAAARNAVEAKKQALADGQRDAFRSLLKRIVPVTAYTRMDRLKSVDPGVFIDSFAVKSERNSATEYIASLDFTFRSDEVRNLLRREGVPFIDEQAPRTVVVPAQRDASTKAVTGDTAWESVWRGLDLDNTVTPVRIDTLKPVIHTDTITMALSGDSSAERIFTTEYGSERVVLLIGEVDRAANKVRVNVVGRDAVGPINWQRSFRLAEGDVSYTLELAAVVTLGVLEGRWKVVKAAAHGGAGAMAGPATEFALQVAFNGLGEWNDLRRRLLETPGVENVRVGAVSARNAEVALSYPGGAGPFGDALARQGLTLRQVGSTWLLTPSF